MRFREYRCKECKCWFRIYDMWDADSLKCPVFGCEGRIEELE